MLLLGITVAAGLANAPEAVSALKNKSPDQHSQFQELVSLQEFMRTAFAAAQSSLDQTRGVERGLNHRINHDAPYSRIDGLHR